MALRIRNKHLLRNAASDPPPVGEVVVAFQALMPIFAVRFNINGEVEWFEVLFSGAGADASVTYRLIEGDEAVVTNWSAMPSVVEFDFDHAEVTVCAE